MAGLRDLLSSPRYEVIPAKGTEQAVAEWVPAGMTVTVTASPVKGLDPTIELTEKLAARGYRVVPHLAARSVTSDAHLDDIVARHEHVVHSACRQPGHDLVQVRQAGHRTGGQVRHHPVAPRGQLLG